MKTKKLAFIAALIAAAGFIVTGCDQMYEPDTSPVGTRGSLTIYGIPDQYEGKDVIAFGGDLAAGTSLENTSDTHVAYWVLPGKVRSGSVTLKVAQAVQIEVHYAQTVERPSFKSYSGNDKNVTLSIQMQSGTGDYVYTWSTSWSNYTSIGIVTVDFVNGQASGEYMTRVSTNGRLNIAGLDDYEGKEIYATGYYGSYGNLHAYDNATNRGDSPGLLIPGTVSSGSAYLNVFSQSNNKYGGYFGNDQNVSFIVYVNDIGSGDTVAMGTATVNFTNGTGLGRFVEDFSTLPPLSGAVTISPVPALVGKELTAAYSGNEAVTCRWFREGITAMYSSEWQITPTERGTYYVIVRAQDYHNITSDMVSVTYPSLTGTVTITPDSNSTEIYCYTTLTASYSGDEDVRYQWYNDGNAVSGTAGSRNTYSPPTEGFYHVVVYAYNYESLASDPVWVNQVQPDPRYFGTWTRAGARSFTITADSLTYIANFVVDGKTVPTETTRTIIEWRPIRYTGSDEDYDMGYALFTSLYSSTDSFRVYAHKTDPNKLFHSGNYADVELFANRLLFTKQQ